MLQRPVAGALLRSSSTLFGKTAAHQTQTRLHNERPTLHATEKKHGLDVQPEQSQRGMMEKESSAFTEARGQKEEPEKEFKNAPGPVLGSQEEWGGSMPFVYPPTWNSFGAFVGA
ncbi:hypothetical protein HOY82DRAFT_645884 [Tuber indicum]|nr:hypothetical protein HOY82DRAFT_645884 [Tuber indicum]